VAIDNYLKGIEILGAYGTIPEFNIIRRHQTALDYINAEGSNNVSRLVISNFIADKYSI
jgi:alkylation response protein AidB-like acyl-CoA dehydrogenase